ncbi:MAG: hypothetical protein ACQERC_12140 [Bacteroidota bacterium]
MKRILTLVIVTIFLLPSAETRAQAYRQDQVYLNAGVSFAFDWFRPTVGNFWNDYNYSFTPPIIVSVEKGLSEYFSAGGYIAHRSYGWSYRDQFNFKYEDRYRRMSFGARISFHYVSFLNKHLDLGLPEEDLDLYLTGALGINTTKKSITRPDEKYTNRDVGFNLGGILGARYFFSSNFGVYLEAGPGGLGFANGGITLKF